MRLYFLVAGRRTEKKLYKARREEERRVRRELYKKAWSAYKRAHVVHLGPGVFWHDTADVDRFDADDPERKRQENALPPLAVGTFLGAL